MVDLKQESWILNSDLVFVILNRNNSKRRENNDVLNYYLLLFVVQSIEWFRTSALCVHSTGRGRVSNYLEDVILRDNDATL